MYNTQILQIDKNKKMYKTMPNEANVQAAAAQAATTVTKTTNSKLELLKKKATAEGVQKVNNAAKLAVRSIDLDNPSVGDILVLAENQIYERKIGNNKANFVYVNRCDDQKNVIPNSTTMLYLGQLTRVVTEYDEACIRTNRDPVKAKGSVVDAIQTYATWNEAIHELEKPFKVSDTERVTTRDFNNPGQTRQQSVYTFDFV